MRIVKVSTPAWSDFGFENFGMLTFTPNLKGIWGQFKFEVNNDCCDCDYWLVVESTQKIEKVNVPIGNTIFLTTEEITSKSYALNYLNQFDKIITSRSDIKGNNVIKTYYVQAWLVRKTFDYLNLNTIQPKTKSLSVISSDLTFLEGHKLRFAFVNRMIGHFKDKLDVYGRGYNYIHDKWDAIAPYKYSIAIENSVIENYFTEKIRDCYLGSTMPIYFGCPNINDFFEDKSYLSIDINDYVNSIHTIEKALEEDLYEKSLPHILESKNKILFEYQFFPHIARILDSIGISKSKSTKTIYPENKIPETPKDINLKMKIAGKINKWTSGFK